jgi:hypothetical protein
MDLEGEDKIVAVSLVETSGDETANGGTGGTE